jgi:hypothetical protein
VGCHDSWAGALHPSCAVHTEAEVVPEAQALDAWIEPDPARAAERQRAGLLEPFHAALCVPALTRITL